MEKVCSCFDVSEEEIREAVKRGAKTVEEVGEATNAGTGCGGCQDRIQQLIDEES